MPRPRSFRRLRALVLAGSVVMVAGGVVGAAGGSPAGDGGAPVASTTTTRPPTTVRPLASEPGLAPVISRVDTTDPVVFLTIDDGHTRDPELAGVLDELGVTATLFLVDNPITQGTEFFRELPGTVVEGHTRSHADLRGRPEAVQRGEICGNADTASLAFRRRPVLFRPPYGHYDEATRRAAASCGMAAIVLWEQTVDGTAMSYRHEPRLRPGDILLFHFRPGLADELRWAVEQVEAAGLRVALLEEYLVPRSVGPRD